MPGAYVVEWTAYMRYRAELRGLDLAAIAKVVRYSNERYKDVVSGRLVAVGRHTSELIMVAYEVDEEVLRPITAHVTTRTQIQNRLKSGRLLYE